MRKIATIVFMAVFLLRTVGSAQAQDNEFFAMDNGLLDVKSFNDKASLLKELGYDGVTWRPGRTAEIVGEMSAHSLKLHALMMHLEVSKEESELPLPLEDIEALKGTGAILWVQLRSKGGNDADALRELRRLNKVAKPVGLRIAIYPHVNTHVESLEEALRVANLVDDDNVGVSLTLCHQLKKQGVQDLAPLLKKALPKLFLVQISGAEAGDTREMDWDKLIQPLGQGSYDINLLLQTLHDLNYLGPIGVIGYRINQPAQQHLKQSISFWREHFATASVPSADQPNIVIILTDDQGYADISLNPSHPNHVSTPHMDALANDGVVFSQAYISGSVCSPTRAGLMLGRYQQRVGVYTAGDGGRGFDPTIPIFPSFLPDEYVSAAIGKWHLGLDEDFPELKWHAMSRGFDECYKFMGRGGHSYFDLRSDSTGKFAHPMYRNKERINDEGYLTNRLTEEAVAFIDRNKAQPFFLYLAYNAVHAPAEAPQADIDRYRKQYPEISEERAILMAMLKHLDDGVGDVVAKLKKEGLFENTLLFFLTDNGGAKGMEANNAPLRGFKHSLYEGGIRTPFIVSWPKKFAGNQTVDTPVISLDILPTVLEGLGVAAPATAAFDGKSLMPLLTGMTTEHHDTLYWSDGTDVEWAVRRGDWKLRVDKNSVDLFNLAKDPSEEMNLAKEQPDRVASLKGTYDLWIAEMVPPITGEKKPRDNKSVTETR